MSEPSAPEPQHAEPIDGPVDGPELPVSAAVPSRERYLRLPRRRRSRWLALGASAMVLLGVAGTVAAAVHHHVERADGRYEVAGPRDGQNSFGGHNGHGGHGQFGGRGHFGRHNGRGGNGGYAQSAKAQHGEGGLAPAPVPAFPADQAAQKAAAAVPGGRVEGLRVVGQQGGGSAWQLDVLGSDGVRHLVTVDGVNGSVTSNTSSTDQTANDK